MSPHPARSANAWFIWPCAASTRNAMPTKRVAFTPTSTRSGVASIQALRRLGTSPATSVKTTSPRMMSWGPGNGSRRKKPVAPAAIARISHTAAAQAAAPGKRGAGSVEAVIGIPPRYGCTYNYWRGKGVPTTTQAAGIGAAALDDCPSWDRTRTLLIQSQACCQLHQGALELLRGMPGNWLIPGSSKLAAPGD